MTPSKIPAITIVVPVYNVEEYIKECIESILAQSMDSFELILVDDGSTDSSGTICEQYACNDERIRVFHKENGGLSSARNYGLKNARGKYITFVDSDDVISKCYLDYMYSAITKYNADIAQGILTTYYDKMNTDAADRRGEKYIIREFNTEEAIKDYLMYKTFFSNTTVKLIKTELFQDIEFPVGKFSEDEYTTYKLLLKANKAICLPKRIYYYRLREGSIVRSYSEKRFEVCDELPNIITNELEKRGLKCQAEVNYKSMRLQIKIYNDFVQGNKYIEFRTSLKRLEKRVRKIPVDFRLWDKKYIIIKILISFFPGLYRTLVSHGRSNNDTI